MNILITGGCGFIGSHLVEALYSKHKIVVLDDLSSGKKDNIPADVPLFCEDVCQDNALAKIFAENKFDVVFHLAAIASVDQCQKNPVRSNEVNFISTIKLLDFCVQNKVKKFIFASSAAVYGKNSNLPLKESAAKDPLSFYGVSKWASESYARIYQELGKIETVNFRFFNVYGPRQNPHSPYSGVLSIFADKVKNSDNPKITIFGDGEQTRDFIYVKDVIQGLILAMEKNNFPSGIYNLGTSHSVSLLEVLRLLESISMKKSQIQYAPARTGDIKFSCADTNLIQAQGFKIQYPLAQGLLEYYQSL